MTVSIYIFLNIYLFEQQKTYFYLILTGETVGINYFI